MIDVRHGDSREVIKTLADASVDSCVCDPPYGLTFMGKHWDREDTPAFSAAFWADVMRALKPGGHLMAFGGTRTYHRLAVAIEDAGFEIRDQIGWLYGSGFPKSHDVSKGIDKAAGVDREVIGWRVSEGGRSGGNNEFSDVLNQSKNINITAPATDAARQWQGWGTALKPAWEPIVLARKPLIGTVAANVLAHGTGAINVDGCRVAHDEPIKQMSAQTGGDKVFGQGGRRGETTELKASGRWPANVIHDGSEEVVAAFPETAPSTTGVRDPNGSMGYHGGARGLPGVVSGHADSGSAARFFYSAKADADDRLGSKHPTVKPVDLMAYLCRLVTPPGGTVLDPFAGSGTTGMACMREGFRAVLIEREAEYVADIRRRIAHVKGEDAPLFGGAA